MYRLGAVSYLNTKPLIHGLKSSLGDRASLSLNLPSRLADDLSRGSLDVALIPSVEFFRGSGYEIVSDAVIACRGPVWSVRLLSRVPTRDIRTLALDEGSRTSAALVRVLLKEIHDIEPDTIPLPMEASPEHVNADAALIIGDRAMHPERGVYREIWDLGDRWCRHTGLPFVFAVWAARAGDLPGWIDTELRSSRDRGLGRLRSIAEEFAGSHGLTTEDLQRYFESNLHFRLGDRERAGLRRFAEAAKSLGLIAPTSGAADLFGPGASRLSPSSSNFRSQ